MGDSAMFWDAVGRVVSQNIAATPIDLTINAEVVKLKNATNGEYLVKYQSDTFSAFTTDPTVTYSVGESVFVLVPQGNFSMKKLIISRASAANNFTYAEMQELTNFFVPQSPNWLDSTFYGIDHTNLGICACPRNKKGAIVRSKGAQYADYAFARWPAARMVPEDPAERETWLEYFGPQAGNITAPENHVDASHRFPTSYPNWETVERCDRMISNWGNTWEWLGIKAKFRTSLLSEHTKGKYGIRVEYLVRNNEYHTIEDADGNEVITSRDHRKYNIKTVELTFESFSGNPYAYVNDTEQVGYFQIPKGTCVGLNRVYLFQNDEDTGATDAEINASDMEVDFIPTYDNAGNVIYTVENEIYDRNNIFACEVDIRWYEKKNLLNSMFLVHITSDRGNTVCNGDDEKGIPEIAYVDLKAHLYYGGKDILNEDDYDVYWYRECPDYRAASWPGTATDIHNNYIASYADDGWAPIFRPDGMTFDDAPQGMFVEEFAPARVDDFSRPVVGDKGHEAANYERISYREIRVPRDKVPWEWYYTCVVVQKQKTEVTDNNGNVVQYDLKDRATCYKYRPFDDGMGVQGYKVMRLDSKYNLELSDPVMRSDGRTGRQYMHITNWNDMDYRYNPPWPKEPWLGNWWYKAPGKMLAAFDGNVKNVLGGRETSGNVEVTKQLGSEYVEFIVGAIDPYLVKDENNDEIEQRWGNSVRDMFVGVIHKTITRPSAEDMVVEWEGDTGFIYNYDGSVKSWFSQDGFSVTPIVKWPKGKSDYVSYRIYGPEGVGKGYEIDTLDYYDAVATDDQTGTQTDTYQLKTGVGHNPECNSMLQNIYIENLEGGLFRVHFSVRQEYNTTYAEGQNSFYLVAESSSGIEYGPFECKIVFNKDGSGANGTGWSADIDTCVNPASEYEKNVLPYSRSRFLNPLVLFRGEDSVGDVHWFNYREGYATKGSPKFPVILRPFIYKGGDGTGTRGDKEYDISVENSQITDFFDFPPELGYWAETYWSVQFGSGVTDANLRFNSYLRFHKLTDGSEYLPTDWTTEAGCPVPKGFDWAGRQGTCAYTHSADGRNGAIEIRFNETIAPPDDGSKGFEFYQFIVTAQTVIYRNCEDKGENGEYKIIPKNPNGDIVTTLWSYYPVDILLITNPDKFDIDNFDPRMIDTNWPREVLYSGTGISPAFDDPAEGLYFFYGKQERLTATGNGDIWDYPRTMISHDFKWYPAYNLTPSTQSLEYIRRGKVTLDDTHQKKIKYNLPEIKVYDYDTDADGNKLPEEDKIYHYEWVAQKYTPIPAINANTLLFGLLSTDFVDRIVVDEDAGTEGATVRTLDNDPFYGCATFFRNQVFQLSRYSNNAVNAWNGRDIMIDNDLGAILAPTIAAGYKNPMTNDFSGVVMGVDQNQRKDGIYKSGLTKTAEGVGNGTFKVSDDKFDNRQYLNSSLFSKYQKENPYMAGVYGYQMGVPSFGLMENGTAFFGRADGGCQIVIDGSNGVIYGGGNGYLTSPSIKDAMWNSMRISLVDNTRDAYKEKILPPENDSVTIELAPEDTVTGAYTSVNVYKGQESNENEPVCAVTDNPVRLDFSEFFAGVNDNGYDMNSRYKLPSWYKRVWETATVKRNSNLPYFLEGGYLCAKDLPNYETEILDKAIADHVDSDELGWGSGEHHGEYHIDYWNTAKLVYKANDREHFGAEELSQGVNRSTFAYGKAATTPAIEIGQHIPGLMPGILGWCAAEDIYKEFYIPGDRNFMVTYDGTLWAMNGVFIGNVIGSNIVGGRLQGCEIGIGCTVREEYQYQKITEDCRWPPLQAPIYEWTTDPLRSDVKIQNTNCDQNDEKRVPAFYVDKYGNASASSMRIFGGSIDIGTFHIRGKKPLSGAASEKAYGELIQYGQSDFVGVTHIYGNIGIGPNLNYQKNMSGGSNYGHLTQINGQVVMGIAFDKKTEDTTVHEWVANQLGMEAKDYANPRNRTAPYRNVGTKIGVKGSLEQAAFFAIDTTTEEFPTSDKESEGYMGHWWPMSYNYDSKNDIVKNVTTSDVFPDRIPGWFTTMTLFKSKAAAAPAGLPGQSKDVQEGANYFRVGPFGSEARFLFFRKKWQDEKEYAKPYYENYYGYIGPTQRLGNDKPSNVGANNWSMGIQTWLGTPLIFNSSANSAWRSMGMIELLADCVGAVDQKNAWGLDTARVIGDGGNWYSGLKIGQSMNDLQELKAYNEERAKRGGSILGFAYKGVISFGASNCDPIPGQMPSFVPAVYGAPGYTNAYDGFADAGLLLCAKGSDAAQYANYRGSWLFNKQLPVHIIQGDFYDGEGKISEIYFSETGQIGISAVNELWITVGMGAHKNPNGVPGLSLTPENMIIGGAWGGKIQMGEKISFEGPYADENNQENIYARFA